MLNERSGLLRSWYRSVRPSFQRLCAMPAARFGALALAGVLVFGALAHDAEARRMGSSRSMGRQSNTVTQQQHASPAPTRVPQQAQTPSATPGAAAQPARNRWLGPIAGLAAGLGIAALLSHFGLGGALAGAVANMLIIAAIAFVAIWLIRKFSRRRDASTPAYAAAGAGASSNASSNRSQGFDQARYNASPADAYPSQASLSTPSMANVQPGSAAAAWSGSSAAATASELTPPAAAPWGVPADFDRESFLHNAKVYFVRMQAAWDAGDLDDIREFTTPEMFAEIRLDLSGRGEAENRTDVVRVDAELLGIEEQTNDHLASVRFSGLIREAKNAPPQEFAEVWNMAKRKQGGEGWLLAGIQQLN